MANHARNLVREYVRSKLAEIPGLEQSVFVDEEDCPKDINLPVVLLDIGDEDISTITMGGPNGRKRARDLQFRTDILCADKKEPKREAEVYAALVENKLSADPRLGGLTKDLQLRALTNLRSEDGAKPMAAIRLQWFATYSTYERDATVPI